MTTPVKRSALRLISIEQPVVILAQHHAAQLPCQVAGIPHARAHAPALGRVA